MRFIITIAFILFCHWGSAQSVWFCSCFEDLLRPEKVIPGDEGKKLKAYIDSIRKSDLPTQSWRNTHIQTGDTTAATLDTFNLLIKNLLQLSKQRAVIDTLQTVKILFVEDSECKWGAGYSHSRYSLSKVDSLIRYGSFLRFIQRSDSQALTSPSFPILSYGLSYGDNHHIVTICGEYTGENSWAWKKVYYLERLTGKEPAKWNPQTSRILPNSEIIRFSDSVEFSILNAGLSDLRLIGDTSVYGSLDERGLRYQYRYFKSNGNLVYTSDSAKGVKTTYIFQDTILVKVRITEWLTNKEFYYTKWDADWLASYSTLRRVTEMKERQRLLLSATNIRRNPSVFK